MKLNWGTGIAIAFSLFAAGMISLVAVCMQQPPDLVSPDYYNRELAFQQQIDKAANTNGLSNPLLIRYDAQQEKVSVVFPSEMANRSISGMLYFFKPDNSALDFQVPVQTDQYLIQQIATHKMKRGLWHVKADWSVNDKSYFQQESVVIN